MNQPISKTYQPVSLAQAMVMDRANYISYGDAVVLEDYTSPGPKRVLKAHAHSSEALRKMDIAILCSHRVPAHIKASYQPVSGDIVIETIH